MEKVSDCGNVGGGSDGGMEAVDAHEYGLVGDTVSGVLLFTDTGRD